MIANALCRRHQLDKEYNLEVNPRSQVTLFKLPKAFVKKEQWYATSSPSYEQTTHDYSSGNLAF